MRKNDIVATVESLLDKARIRRPPVDLDIIAQSQGVKKVERVRMGSVLGMTTQTRTGFNIRLNSRVPMKERFTYAHEIAHTLLMPPSWKSGGVHRRTQSAGDALERLCDQIAAEILMPLRWARPVVRRGRPGAGSVVRMAQTFNTSLQAAAVRLAELSGRFLGISCWRANAQSQSLMWEAGDRDLCAHVRPLIDRGHGPRLDAVDHALRCKHSVVWQGPAVGFNSAQLVELLGLGSKPSRRMIVVVRNGFPDHEFGVLQAALHRNCSYQPSAAKVA